MGLCVVKAKSVIMCYVPGLVRQKRRIHAWGWSAGPGYSESRGQWGCSGLAVGRVCQPLLITNGHGHCQVG